MNPIQPSFDTRRSEAHVKAFADRDFVAKRRVITFIRTVPAVPEEVFLQLCPTREHDWIDGWSSELIYTESGYGEDQCVFRTSEDGATGPGLWTFSHVDAPHLLKIVRVVPPFLQHLCIALTDNGDGTTETRWTVTITALTAEGNKLMEALPADDESFAASAENLVYFFANGSMRIRSKGDRGHGHGRNSVHGFLAAASRKIQNRRT